MSGLVVFGSLAAALQILGYMLYVRHCLRGSIRPNAASWLMFAYGTALLAFLETENSASLYLLALPAMCASLSAGVAALSFHRGVSEPVDRAEVFVFSTDLWLTVFYLALIVWIPKDVMPESVRGGFLVAVNATAVTCFLPIIRSTLQAPQREKKGPWAVWTAAYATLAVATLFSPAENVLVLLVYPMLNMILHATVLLLSLRKYGTGQTFREDRNQIVRTGRSKVHGMGIFSGRDYAQGEEVWTLRGRPVVGSLFSADPNVIGFAENFWIDPEQPFDMINHSCEPNAAFGSEGRFRALRPILKNEEIFIDYSTTEADPEWSMQCNCGALSCRKELKAIQIAFAENAFPPPASPGMQMIWRDYRVTSGQSNCGPFSPVQEVEAKPN